VYDVSPVVFVIVEYLVLLLVYTQFMHVHKLGALLCSMQSLKSTVLVHLIKSIYFMSLPPRLVPEAVCFCRVVQKLQRC